MLQPSDGQTDDRVQVFGKDTASSRPGRPAKIALASVFLATGVSSFITGEKIGVTGGTPIA